MSSSDSSSDSSQNIMPEVGRYHLEYDNYDIKDQDEDELIKQFKLCRPCYFVKYLVHGFQNIYYLTHINKLKYNAGDNVEQMIWDGDIKIVKINKQQNILNTQLQISEQQQQPYNTILFYMFATSELNREKCCFLKDYYIELFIFNRNNEQLRLKLFRLLSFAMQDEELQRRYYVEDYNADDFDTYWGHLTQNSIAVQPNRTAMRLKVFNNSLCVNKNINIQCQNFFFLQKEVKTSQKIAQLVGFLYNKEFKDMGNSIYVSSEQVEGYGFIVIGIRGQQVKKAHITFLKQLNHSKFIESIKLIHKLDSDIQEKIQDQICQTSSK